MTRAQPSRSIPRYVLRRTATCSAFSFLRGASFPEQLAERAAELGLPAVALLDRNGVYGAQRFSVACREQGMRPIIGSDLTMEDGTLLPVLVENRDRLQKSLLPPDSGASAERKGKLSGGMERAARIQCRADRAPGERTRLACSVRRLAGWLDDFQAPSTKKFTASRVRSPESRRPCEIVTRSFWTRSRLRRDAATSRQGRRTDQSPTDRSGGASSASFARDQRRATCHPSRPRSARRFYLHPRTHPSRCRGHSPNE